MLHMGNKLKKKLLINLSKPGDYIKFGIASVAGAWDIKDANKNGEYGMQKERVNLSTCILLSLTCTSMCITYLINLVPRVLSYSPYGARDGG